MTNGITAEEAIKAIKDSKGFVTTVAKRLGCTRQHVYVIADRFPTVKAAIEEEREGLKDFAEGKLIQQIDAGNIAAIIFYLKTQAKGRGYIERQEISGPEGGPIDMTFNQAVKKVYNGDSHPDTP